MEEHDDRVRGRRAPGARPAARRGTSFADASPGLPGPAVQAEISSSSSTCVAPMTAMRWPLIVRRNGRYACSAFSADPDDREAVAAARRRASREAPSRRSPFRGCWPSTRRRRPRPQSAANALGGARKTNVLAAGGAARRDRGLEVHDGEVRTVEDWADRMRGRQAGCRRAPFRSSPRSGRRRRTRGRPAVRLPSGSSRSATARSPLIVRAPEPSERPRAGGGRSRPQRRRSDERMLRATPRRRHAHEREGSRRRVPPGTTASGLE